MLERPYRATKIRLYKGQGLLNVAVPLASYILIIMLFFSSKGENIVTFFCPDLLIDHYFLHNLKCLLLGICKDRDKSLSLTQKQPLLLLLKLNPPTLQELRNPSIENLSSGIWEAERVKAKPSEVPRGLSPNSLFCNCLLLILLHSAHGLLCRSHWHMQLCSALAPNHPLPPLS